LVLANPGEPLATKDVFSALASRFTPDEARPALDGLRDAAALANALQGFGNDLAAPATEILPVIGDVLRALQSTSGCLLVRLSGSGPTCFGLYGDEAAARQAADSLRAANGAWWVAAAPMLPADAALVS
jgi:4-diphosphocytidyl-2-C-methyl-D-erythritol kinase